MHSRDGGEPPTKHGGSNDAQTYRNGSSHATTLPQTAPITPAPHQISHACPQTATQYSRICLLSRPALNDRQPSPNLSMHCRRRHGMPFEVGEVRIFLPKLQIHWRLLMLDTTTPETTKPTINKQASILAQAECLQLGIREIQPGSRTRRGENPQDADGGTGLWEQEDFWPLRTPSRACCRPVVFAPQETTSCSTLWSPHSQNRLTAIFSPPQPPLQSPLGPCDSTVCNPLLHTCAHALHNLLHRIPESEPTGPPSGSHSLVSSV
jgi:hypothetical protein